MSRATRWRLAGLAVVALLAFVRLEAWPLMWFDEGVHLHVPKALVKFGVYADYASDGFRYYGPTMSVGPTVMLPIAAAFKVAGIGLWQARAVVASYLVLAVALYFTLGRRLFGERVAWAASALLVASTGVDLLYLGRQGLGEVPAFAFALAGLLACVRAWDRPATGTLVFAGVMLGLAVVTKYQFLIVLAPALALAWFVNRVYHRAVPDRCFLVPLVFVVGAFTIWQAVGILYLGPSTASENLALMRRAAAGAAFTFSLASAKRALESVFSVWLYAALLVPALAYAGVLAAERSREGLKWALVLALVLPNLAWFVAASIGWPRYAFPSYAVAGFAVARLLSDLTDGFRRPRLMADGPGGPSRPALAAAGWVLVVVAVVLPLGRRTVDLARPPVNHPQQVAAYLDAHVPTDAVIETWEQELEFLTEHRYHYPPPALLIEAVAHIFSGGPSPSEAYDFRAAGLPDYVVRGAFGTWVGVYPDERVDGAYTVERTIGPYTIFRRTSRAAQLAAPGPLTTSPDPRSPQ